MLNATEQLIGRSRVIWGLTECNPDTDTFLRLTYKHEASLRREVFFGITCRFPAARVKG
jgi:hypothetical protein